MFVHTHNTKEKYEFAMDNENGNLYTLYWNATDFYIQTSQHILPIYYSNSKSLLVYTTCWWIYKFSIYCWLSETGF
jgi:hypothetical protein